MSFLFAATGKHAANHSFGSRRRNSHWQWFNVLGRQQDSSSLDRYTSPGRNAAISLRYRR